MVDVRSFNNGVPVRIVATVQLDKGLAMVQEAEEMQDENGDIKNYDLGGVRDVTLIVTDNRNGLGEWDLHYKISDFEQSVTIAKDYMARKSVVLNPKNVELKRFDISHAIQTKALDPVRGELNEIDESNFDYRKKAMLILFFGIHHVLASHEINSSFLEYADNEENVDPTMMPTWF